MLQKVLPLWFVFLVGCMSNHFYVQQGKIDASTLASSHLGTPDPRLQTPPQGDELLVSWHFPKELLEEILTLEFTVRFWDGKEEQFFYPIERKWGYKQFFFTQEGKEILTYLVRALSEKGEVVGYWEHQLWTPLIEIGR
ncbi:MAG TPA: hypothetical protein VJK48_04025 [Chlamydiales bacterium]|nr:hypothetical protein [Chlamydiales bacterium]